MRTIFNLLIGNPRGRKPQVRSRQPYQPQPPLGFIRRSDPNYYFLNRR